MNRIALALTTLTAIVHLAVVNRYDVFRDELYFIVSGRHPAWGYVDQPPLVPLLAAVLYAPGEQLWLLRLPAALAAAGLVWLTIAFAELLGGGRAAALAAGLAVAIAPMLIGLTGTLGTTTFEPLAWTAIAYALTRATLLDDRRALLWAGALAGVAMQAKYALPAWLLSLGIGLAVTQQRRLLARPELWLGLLLAAVIALPSVLWQAAHGWPFAEIVRAADEKNLHASPAGFIVNQIFVLNPVLAPLWIGGIVAPFVRSDLRPVRFLAIAFLAVCAIVLATHGKDYYLAAAFPTMFAVGAVAFERVVRNRFARAAYLVLAIPFSVIALPLTLPILSPAGVAAYQEKLGVRSQAQEKHSQGSVLPQAFADQLPWRHLEKAVAAAYRGLSPSERAGVAIVTNNDGEAAALDVFGRPDDLPPAISGHNQYYLWGTHGRGAPILRVNGKPERWAKLCPGSAVVGRASEPLAVPEERDVAIILCRHPSPGILGKWEDWKDFN